MIAEHHFTAIGMTQSISTLIDTFIILRKIDIQVRFDIDLAKDKLGVVKYINVWKGCVRSDCFIFPDGDLKRYLLTIKKITANVKITVFLYTFLCIFFWIGRNKPWLIYFHGGCEKFNGKQMLGIKASVIYITILKYLNK